MSNTIGELFRVTSFGESHGQTVGVIVDGCPAGISLTETDLQPDLERRRPGQNRAVSPREEEDRPIIQAGVFNGLTTGAPICMTVANKNIDSSTYEAARLTPRPGHADFTSYIKYGGYSDYRGGGRFSGRITAGFVMAGTIAKKVLAEAGIKVTAYAKEIGGIKADPSYYSYLKEPVLQPPLYCPDPGATEKMLQAISRAVKDRDSLGGVIEVIGVNVPSGWGEPVMDTLDGCLAKAFFAIPSVKGVEFGAGFEAARMRGSENNDQFIMERGEVRTETNMAGGILGGISSGMPIIARVAIKPTPSISQTQHTVNLQVKTETELRVEGRHDPCIVPRAVVVIEAMMAITLCDFGLLAGAVPRIIK